MGKINQGPRAHKRRAEMPKKIEVEKKRGKPRQYYQLSEKADAIRWAKAYGRHAWRYECGVGDWKEKGIFVDKVFPAKLHGASVEILV
jgi:hypothetical protein